MFKKKRRTYDAREVSRYSASGMEIGMSAGAVTSALDIVDDREEYV
jgi:hypothetical protein